MRTRLPLRWSFSFSLAFLLVAAPGTSRGDEGLKRFGASARLTLGRLDLYRLVGSARDVGRAAGALAPAGSYSEREGMLPFMATYVENLVRHQDMVRSRPWLSPFVNAFLEFRYYRALRGHIGQETREFIAGISETSGLSEGDLTRALVNPDLALTLLSDAMAGRLLPVHLEEFQKNALQLYPRSPVGCTTIAVPPEDSADGRAMVGRVQDYPAVGRFDAHPAVFYVAKTGRYRYLQVATAGIAVGAITAMNEHGLVLTMQTGVNTESTVANTPGLLTTGAMIEGARTIEEAAAICNRRVPVAGWIINLVDVASGRPRSAWLEVDPGDGVCRLSFAEGAMVTTNHYRIPGSQAHELHPGPSIDENSVNRRERARALLAEKRRRGPITVTDVMTILGDRFDPSLGRHLGYGPSAIAALDQVVAVVFRPETREVLVSNGHSPPASRGQYLHFSFDDFERLEDLATASATERVAIDARTLTEGTESALSRWPAYDSYLAAERALNAHGDANPAEALGHLHTAVALEPAEPALKLVRALVLLRLGRPAEALPDLDAVLAPGPLALNAHRLHLARLSRGKALDVLGRREEALREYGLLLTEPRVYGPLRAAAGHFAGTPCQAADLGRIGPDLKYMDTMAYE